MRTKTLLKRIMVSREIESRVDAMPKHAGSFGRAPWGFDAEGSNSGQLPRGGIPAGAVSSVPGLLKP
jgi:hypothetical protein